MNDADDCCSLLKGVLGMAWNLVLRFKVWLSRGLFVYLS